MEIENTQLKSLFTEKFDKMAVFFAEYQYSLNDILEIRNRPSATSFMVRELTQKNGAFEIENVDLRRKLEVENQNNAFLTEKLRVYQEKLLRNSEEFKGRLAMFFENSIQPQLFVKIQILQEEIRFKDSIIRNFNAENLENGRGNLTGKLNEFGEVEKNRKNNFIETSKKQSELNHGFMTIEKHRKETEKDEKTTAENRNVSPVFGKDKKEKHVFKKIGNVGKGNDGRADLGN